MGGRDAEAERLGSMGVYYVPWLLLRRRLLVRLNVDSMEESRREREDYVVDTNKLAITKLSMSCFLKTQWLYTCSRAGPST